MKCSKCGETDHASDAKYCHICGAKLVKSTNFIGRTTKTGVERVHSILPKPIKNQPQDTSDTSWDVFNCRISRIGKWIQDNSDIIAIIITAILALIFVAIPLVMWNVEVFSEYGFIIGVLSLFVDLMAIGLCFYPFVFVYLVITGIIYLIGYIFYNAYSFIITIAVGMIISLLIVAVSNGYI
jgi:hypothetical protein